MMVSRQIACYHFFSCSEKKRVTPQSHFKWCLILPLDSSTSKESILFSRVYKCNDFIHCHIVTKFIAMWFLLRSTYYSVPWKTLYQVSSRSLLVQLSIKHEWSWSILVSLTSARNMYQDQLVFLSGKYQWSECSSPPFCVRIEVGSVVRQHWRISL